MKGINRESNKFLYKATFLRKEINMLRELATKEGLPKFQQKIQETTFGLEESLCVILDAIQSVPDPVVRRAMEMVYLNGLTLEVASGLYPCSVRTIKRYIAIGQEYVKEYLKKNDFKE